MLFWTALGSLAAVVALLLALDIFPSADSSDSDTPTVVRSDRNEPEESAGSADKESRGGEKLWGGEISLVVDKNYALDGFPVEPFEGYCDGCVMVNSFTPELSFQAENGVRDWSDPAPPDYADCARLLESGPAPSVSLVTSPNSEGVEVGEWACAYSKSGEVLRLRYLGESQDEMNFRFAVTGWRQPS
jgi:hypothetical protein